jgi:hypothetical protein
VDARGAASDETMTDQEVRSSLSRLAARIDAALADDDVFVNFPPITLDFANAPLAELIHEIVLRREWLYRCKRRGQDRRNNLVATSLSGFMPKAA